MGTLAAQKKTGNIEKRVRPSLCPGKAIPAAPIDHNCQFTNDPISPLNHLSAEAKLIKTPYMLIIGLTSPGRFLG